MTETNATDRELAVRELAATLGALIGVRSGVDEKRRNELTLQFLRNEVATLRTVAQNASLEETIAAAAALTPQEIAGIRHRCLFYGCDELVALLVNKRIRSDAIAREEAILYVQDRLQRDDFRRIRSFTADRGASFVTYMWQVINNLLLDFLRARGKHGSVNAVEDESSEGLSRLFDRSGAHDAPETSPESAFDEQSLRALIAGVSGELSRGALHEKLRPYLNLTSKERIMLKAMFQYDMTIAEVRELPGMGLSVNEAYRLYYRIMEQLLDAFKRAGVLDALRLMVAEAAPRVSVTFVDRVFAVEVTGILYMASEDADTTSCHADWRGAIRRGSIHEGFSRLLKRFAAYFVGIDSKVAISERVLADTYGQWSRAGELVIDGVGRTFRLGARALQSLKDRFGEKSSP